MPETTHAAEFLEALTSAKEKLKKEEKKKKEKKPEKKKAEKKEKEVRKKLEEISVEKLQVPARPAKPLAPEPVPPIYKRPLPPLPSPSEVTKEEWPLRPPKPPARPPEEEAAAPPTPEVITPAAPEAVPVKPLLDLGKLNPLVADVTITAIQCDGANIPIKIIRAGRIEETPMILTEEEIKSIIKAFSEVSGQAITEPMFKASAAGWTISATISAFAGTKFVITRG